MDNQMKELMDELINKLKSKGINAQASVIDLGNMGKDISNKDIKRMVTEAFERTKKAMSEQRPYPKADTTSSSNKENKEKEAPKENSSLGQEDQKDLECFCKKCAFDHFEEILKDEKGKFDYTQAFVGGKVFDIKYWTDGETEHLVIDKHEEPKKSIEEQFKELHDVLNQAIQKSDFTRAQEILTEISQLTNRKEKN